MIASRRGVYVLSVIAALLAVVLAIDARGPRGPVDHALLPGFTETTATRIVWTAPPGFAIERKDTTWRRVAPDGELDQAAVRTVLAALRGARWHRRAARSAAEPAPTAIDIDGTRIFVGLAAHDEQQWLAIGDTAYLVDAWVARALVPRLLDLAITRPLAAAPSAPTIQIDELRFEGSPRRLVAPVAMLLDPTASAALDRMLSDLQIVELPAASAPLPTAGLTITLGGTTALLSPACPTQPTLAYLSAPSGGGCVRKDVADELLAFVTTIRTDPSSLVSLSPAPIAPTSITLTDGSILDLTRRPRITLVDGRTFPADATKVATLLAILSAPATLGPPATTISSSILRVDTPTSSISLELSPGAVHRSGEPRTLLVSATAAAILRSPGASYRDLSIWLEDPTTISAIQVGTTTFARGATLGEWSNARDPASLEALAAALASPRALSLGSPPTNPTRITLTITAPAGPATTRTLDLGLTGCIARIGDDSYILPAALCRAVRAAR